MPKLIIFTIVVSMILITDAKRGLIKPTLNKTLPHHSGQHRFLSSDLNDNVYVTKCDETAVIHTPKTSLMKMSGSLEVIWQIDFPPLLKCNQAISAVGRQGVYSFFQSSDPLRWNENKVENSLTLMKVDLDGNKIFDDVVLRHLRLLDSSFPDSPAPLSPLQTDSGDNLFVLAEVCSERDSEWETGQVLLMKLQSDGKEVWTRPVASSPREQIQLMSVSKEGQVLLLLSRPRLSTEDHSQNQEYCLLHLDSDGSTTHFSCPVALNQIGPHGSLTPSYMHLDASLDLYLLGTMIIKSPTESIREVLLKFSHGNFQTPQWTREINDELLKTESLGLTPYQVNRHHSSVLVCDKSGQVFLMSLLLGMMLVSMLTEDGVEHLSLLELDLGVDVTNISDMMFLISEGRKHLLLSFKRTQDQDYSHLVKYVFDFKTKQDHHRTLRVSRRLSGEDDVKFCRDGWTMFGDNCYYFVPDRLRPWPTCQYYCGLISAEMLCIMNAAENAFIFSMITGNTWIGYSDAATEGSFVWNSGCSSTYTNWYGLEPNNAGSGEDYAAMYFNQNGEWADWSSTSSLGCACQTPSFTFNPTPNPCSSGWTFFDGVCYYAGNTVSSYTDCRTQCSNMNSDMLCVEDAVEDEFLTTLMNNVGYGLWLGYNDEAVEGTFSWEGNCSSSFSDWGTNQPDNAYNAAENGQDYTAKRFVDGGKWNDFSIDGQDENVCACQAPPIIPIVTCPQGWTLFGDNCYYVGSIVSYTTCKSECSSLSAEMLCVEDSREDAFLDILMINTGSLWLGLNDEAVEGVYEWEGTCSSNYTNWDVATGQPNNLSNQDYIYKSETANGRWHDINANGTRFCACQFPAPTSSPTAVPTLSPSGSPTATPSYSPSSFPTIVPTTAPTPSPTIVPTSVPSAVPTISPTARPTLSPSTKPSSSPTLVPTYDSVWKPLSGPVIEDSPMGFARIHGYLYVTGFTRLYANGTSNLEDFDAFVYKMNSSLIREWRMHMGGVGNDVGLGVASDSDGNVYVTGKTQASRLGFSSLGGSDVYVSKLNIDGVEQWTVQFGSPEDDMGRKIVVQETDGGNDGKTVLVVVSGSMGGGVFEAVFNTDGQLLQG